MANGRIYRQENFIVFVLCMTVTNYTVCQKNAPNLASFSFDKNGLILIIFGKQHEHTFRNDTHVQLSLSLHFYLLYLLLNSCDGNDVFWRHSVLVKQSSSFSRKHQTLSLQICVRQTVRLTTEFVDWCRNVCTLYKRLSTNPAAVTSDLKQRFIDTWQACRKTSSTKQLVSAHSGCVQAWRQNDITSNIS